MNPFESTLSATLRHEAEEISVSTDMVQAERKLQESIRSADRKRRVWFTVGAAAAVVALIAGTLTLVRAQQPAPPVIGPQPSPTASTNQQAFHFTTKLMTPNLSVDLPYWAALAADSGQDPGGANFAQADCPGSLCPADNQLSIRMFSIASMYRLDDPQHIVVAPTFGTYVDAWDAVDTLGHGTITDQGATTVDGRPAVTMTVAFTKDTTGLRCPKPTDKVADCLYVVAGRVWRMAIVDQGKDKPPTVLLEGWNADNPAGQDRADEFDAWLTTVRFEPAG